MLPRYTFPSLQRALTDSLEEKGGAAGKIIRVSRQIQELQHKDTQSLLAMLLDIRNTKDEISRNAPDKPILAHLDMLEKDVKTEIRTLNRKVDGLILLNGSRRPGNFDPTVNPTQRSRIATNGRLITQNIATGRFERKVDVSNKQEGKSPDTDLLKGILVYQKKIYEQGLRSGKISDKLSKDLSRAGRTQGGFGRSLTADTNKGGGGEGGGGSFLGSLFGGMGGELLGGLLGGGAAGGLLSGGVGGLAKKAIPAFIRNPFGLAAGAGVAATYFGYKNLGSLYNYVNKEPSPEAAPVKPGASGPNAGLFKGLPSPIVNPNQRDFPVGTPAEADSPVLRELILSREKLKKEIEELKKNMPSKRNARNYKVDEAEQQLAGINNQIQSIQSGGAAGGSSSAGTRGGTAANTPFIPGVTPGAGQTQAQAQADARQAIEQSKMPTYNPGMSPNSSLGQAKEMPGAGPAPASIGDLPITMGGASPQVIKDAITGKGQGVTTTSTGGFYPGKDVMGGQSVAKTGEPDYTQLGQAKKGDTGYRDYAYQFFKSRGYSDEQASIVMGQTNAESKFDPRSLNPNDAPKQAGKSYDIGNGQTYTANDSIGLQQRNGDRALGMIKNGEAIFGKKWSDMSNQERMYADLDYTDKELKGTDTTNPSGGGQYKKTGDLLSSNIPFQEKAATFGKRFEGYAGDVQQGRTNDAMAYADMAQKGQMNKDFTGKGNGSAINLPGMSAGGVGETPRASMADLMPNAVAGDPKNAQFATVNPAAVVPSSGGSAPTPSVIEKQGQIASIRTLPIQSGLKDQLQFAAEKMGLSVEVGSGGQPSSGPNRTGSHRHDDGGAADLKLYETDDKGNRRMLDMSNPADAQKMQQFTQEAVRAGATGVGAGPNYMGNSTIHIGGGSIASWGGAPWIADALKNGMSDKENGSKEFQAWKEKRDAALAAGQPAPVPTTEAVAGMPQSPEIPVPGKENKNPAITPEISSTPAANIPPPAVTAPIAAATPVDSVSVAPTRESESIFTGRKAPDDLKSRTLGAQMRAYAEASQEHPLEGDTKKPDDATNTIKPADVVTQGPPPVITAKPYDFSANAAAEGANYARIQARISDANKDAASFKSDFDKRFDNPSYATGSAQTPPEMSTPSQSYERQPTVPPPQDVPVAAPQVDSSPKSDDAGGGVATKATADDPAGGDKKMSEIEMQINDFGLLGLNTTDLA